MPYDIGPVIGIEGEKEFRNSIKQINENMKTLGTEMKAVASQFDKNDNSTTALTEKNKVLNKQIDEQKNKLLELQKGLATASEKYGENDKVTQGWRRAVNQATADLNNMEHELKNNTETMEKAKNPADDLGKEIKQVGDHAEDAGKKAFTMGDMIKANLISEAIISGVKALGSAIISVAKGIGDAVSETIDYTSEISDMSQRTGVAAEELQKYSYAAKMSGMEMGTLEKAMIRSQKSFADAKTGSKTLQESYRALSIDINKINNSSDAFDKTIRALADMKDETKRNALANDLFGKSYAELAPLLNEGAAGIDALKTKAEELGIVLSEDAVNAGEALGDTLDTLKLTIGGVANSLISLLLPGLSSLANNGVSFISEFAKEIQGANGDIGKIGEVIGKALSDLVSKITDNAPKIMEGAKNLIFSFINGIMDNLPQIAQSGIVIVMDLIKGLLEALPQIIQTGLEVIINLANGIAESLPELVPTIVNTVLFIVETLINNVDALIDAAIAIIMGLTEGLINALPELVKELPKIVEAIVNGIVDNLPMLIDAAIEIILALVFALIENLPLIYEASWKIMKAIFNGLIKVLFELNTVGIKILEKLKEKFSEIDWGELGKGIINGIKNGVINMATSLANTVKEAAQNALNTVKDFLGIHSPSTVFADVIGKNMALGIGVGFEKEMNAVSKQISNAIPTEVNMSVTTEGRLNSTGSSSYGGFTQNVNIYSPSPLSPSEIARQTRNASRRLALGVNK